MLDQPPKLEVTFDPATGTPPKRVRKPRLTVVGNVYFESPGSPAVASPLRSARWLESDEQPYQRTTTAKRDWEPLDIGWLKDDGGGVSMLVVRNDDKERPLQLRFGIPSTSDPNSHLTVTPGESAVFKPTMSSSVYVRGPFPVKYTVTAYPA